MGTQTKKIMIALLFASLAYALMIVFYTPQQSSMVALVVLMVALWTNEGLPLAVVSLLPILLFPAFGIVALEKVTLNYANPIIYLFLGGFMLAIAVEKTGLHRVIAYKILSVFPKNAWGILFALLFTSGLLSSILSNTTTTLLLLPIALFLSEMPKLKLRFALAIAYGASVGGILTPIGTPPNLILLGFLSEHGIAPIPFIQWVAMVSPLVLMMLLVVGVLLGFGIRGIKIEPVLETTGLTKEQKKVLAVLFGVMGLLFANAPIQPYYPGLGFSETGILLGAGLLLFAPPFGILDWMEDKDKIPFRIMMLFGAGFAIAQGFSVTGLAQVVADGLTSLSALPLLLFILLIATVVTFSTEITSNTALISIMLPVLLLISQQTQMDARLIMMVATVCSSFAFMLPIATPPNAIVMSSGTVTIKAMALYGLVLNIVGILVIVLVSRFVWAETL